MSAPWRELAEALRARRWLALRQAGQAGEALRRAKESERRLREDLLLHREAARIAQEALSTGGRAWQCSQRLLCLKRRAREEAAVGEQVSLASAYASECAERFHRCQRELGCCQARLEAAAVVLAEDVRRAARLGEAVQEGERTDLSGNRTGGPVFCDTARLAGNPRPGKGPGGKSIF